MGLLEGALSGQGIVPIRVDVADPFVWLQLSTESTATRSSPGYATAATSLRFTGASLRGGPNLEDIGVTVVTLAVVPLPASLGFGLTGLLVLFSFTNRKAKRATPVRKAPTQNDRSGLTRLKPLDFRKLKRFNMTVFIKKAALAAMFSIFGTQLFAATVTNTYDFTITDFTSRITVGLVSPIETVTGRIEVTFDSGAPSNDVMTTGVRLISSNFLLDSDITLAYRYTLGGTLQIGGIAPGGSFGGTFAGDNDFFLGIRDATSAAPSLFTFAYSQSDEPLAAYLSDTGSVSLSPAVVPLPASIAFLLGGLGFLTALRPVRTIKNLQMRCLTSFGDVYPKGVGDRFLCPDTTKAKHLPARGHKVGML